MLYIYKSILYINNIIYYKKLFLYYWIYFNLFNLFYLNNSFISIIISFNINIVYINN